jgi:hypothetical protein
MGNLLATRAACARPSSRGCNPWHSHRPTDPQARHGRDRREHEPGRAMTASKNLTTGNPLARLAEADRIELRQHRLSFEVTTACLAWLHARGLLSPTPPAARPPQANVEATTAMPANEPQPPGSNRTWALHNSQPCPAGDSYGNQKTIFGQRPITLSPNKNT